MTSADSKIPAECEMGGMQLSGDQGSWWRNILGGIVGRMPDSPIVRRLAEGAFWSLVGTAATRIFTVASTIAIARILGKENYGILGMVLSTFAMFGILAGFSLGGTTTKYLSEYRVKEPEKAGRILSLTNTTAFVTGGLVLGLVLAFAPWLARELLNKSELGSLIRVGGLLLFLNALNNVQVGTLAGFEAFKSIAKINFWQGLSTPLIAIPLVYWFGILGAIVAHCAVAAIGLYLCRKAIRFECRRFNICYGRFDLSALMEEKQVLWIFSLPALTSGLMVIPVMWLCNLLLVRQPNGYAELGLFNAANQWRLIIIIVPQILASVMLPIFSEIHGRDNKEDFLHAFNINLSLTWVFALPLTIGLIIIREPLSVVFGKQYIGMSPIIVPLMITAFLNIVNNVVGTALAGTGKMWLGTVFNIGWAAAFIIGNFFLLPVFGAMGMAYAYLISYLLHTLWQIAYTERILAPKVLSKLVLLMIITIVSFISIIVVSYIGVKSVIINILILLISLFPVVKLGREKMFST